jgi:hypothetical protein
MVWIVSLDLFLSLGVYLILGPDLNVGLELGSGPDLNGRALGLCIGLGLGQNCRSKVNENHKTFLFLVSIV